MLTLPLLGVAGVASAAETFGGPGSDTARTSDVAQLTVHQTGVIAGLAPGGRAQPLSGSFDNRTGSAVVVAKVTARIIGVTEAPDATGTCDPADFTITGSDSDSGHAVPAGADQGSWSGLSLSLTNTSANQDACKNAVPLITYAVS